MTETEPYTPEELEEIKREHALNPFWPMTCLCLRDYPCSTARLIKTVEEERALRLSDKTGEVLHKVMNEASEEYIDLRDQLRQMTERAEKAEGDLFLSDTAYHVVTKDRDKSWAENAALKSQLEMSPAVSKAMGRFNERLEIVKQAETIESLREKVRGLESIRSDVARQQDIINRQSETIASQTGEIERLRQADNIEFHAVQRSNYESCLSQIIHHLGPFFGGYSDVAHLAKLVGIKVRGQQDQIESLRAEVAKLQGERDEAQGANIINRNAVKRLQTESERRGKALEKAEEALGEALDDIDRLHFLVLCAPACCPTFDVIDTIKDAKAACHAALREILTPQEEPSK